MTLHYVSSRKLAKPKTYFFGVDLGQGQDYTALTVLEREQVDTGRRVTDAFAQIYHGSPGGDFTKPVIENHFAVRHLERLPTGTSYPAQVKRIKELFGRLKADTEKTPHLMVDQTGVGRPATDMLALLASAPYLSPSPEATR